MWYYHFTTTKRIALGVIIHYLYLTSKHECLKSVM